MPMIDKLIDNYNDLEFEPISHTYTIKGEQLTPVSDRVGQFYEHFDTDNKAIEYAERHGGDPLEIAKSWRQTGIDACDFGSMVHDFAERYFYDDTEQPSCEHEKAVIAFWNSLPSHIRPLAAELRIYSERMQTAGTIDNLFFNMKTNTVIMSDYKTNKNLYKNFRGKKMYEPFDFMLDMPLSHYELQLSLYHAILKESDVPVSEKWVIWLKPDGSFEKIIMHDYSEIIEKEILNNHNHVNWASNNWG